jgi:hypothetical protein
MKDVMLLYWSLAVVCLVTCGCGPQEPRATGFLSDYSHLKPETEYRFRYFPFDNRLARYSAFIVDPVELRLDDNTKMELGEDEELEKLRVYLQDALVETLGRRYRVANVTPGPGVGRIRAALTHLKKGAPFTIGGAAIEAELLDTQTGEQVVAILENQQVRRRSGGGFSEWDDAKGVIDDWAQRFYDKLEEAHAKK